MTSHAIPMQGNWRTAFAVLIPLEWLGVLALAMWLGSNGPRPIAAWFVAYPMFVLYPGVAALAASRAGSSTAVNAVATLTAIGALAWALAPAMVQEGPYGVRDDRDVYLPAILVAGFALALGIRAGTRLIRRGHSLIGMSVAGAVFVLPTVVAFYAAISFTTY